MLSETGNHDIVMSQGIDMIGFYRENPCIAAYDLLGVDLAPAQRVVFEDMWFKDYAIVVAGRGYGKSFLLGVLASLSSLLYPGYRTGLISATFRQSKIIFSEVEKLWSGSSIMREATEKRPIRGSDICYLKFNNIPGMANGSYIEALPLGNDGSKIRGSRFYLICIDELAQVPDKIIDLVLRPMAAVVLNPMKNVRRIERHRRLVEMGLATQDDLEPVMANKIIMTSSGYYKFNHMWRRMKSYWKRMEEDGEKSRYVVWQIPYWELPDGFLDKKNVEEAQRVMSRSEYSMEYEAAMISDSEGFFKASLIEYCTSGNNFNIELTGDSTCRYILGVDPNQGGEARCGVVIVKMEATGNKIVNVLQLEGKTTQDLVKSIQLICEEYNVIRIFMDKGGGGKAISDLLEEGYDECDPIIDRTNEDHKHMKGRHILELVNFNPSWISDANFTTLSMLEDRKLLFPEPPIASTLDSVDSAFENIGVLKSQMLNIIVTQTSTGMLHFDTPKKGQNKDLYSAMILAAQGIRAVEKELEESGDPILYSSSGLIRPSKGKGPLKPWDVINTNTGTIKPFIKKSIPLAVLQKRPK